MTTTTPDLCPRCQSPDLFTVRCESGPHYARTGCQSCGAHLRFELAPITDERAAAFTMPYGKHRGKTLAEIPIDYLAWLLNGADNTKPAMRRLIEHEMKRRRGML